MLCNRVRVLRDHKEQQLDDLSQFERSRASLSDKAHALAERYEDSSEKQQQLIQRQCFVLEGFSDKISMFFGHCNNRQMFYVKIPCAFRVEMVLTKLQAKLPVLSDAEKNMHKDLKTIAEKIDNFNSSIKEVRIVS